MGGSRDAERREILAGQATFASLGCYKLALSKVEKDLAQVLDRVLGCLCHSVAQCVAKGARKCVCTFQTDSYTIELILDYSAFFAFLASFMIPANLPVQLFLFVS